MVLINMQISKGVYEIANFKAADVRHEMCQQRIAADIERDAEERIRRPLVKLAMQGAFILDLELKQGMTRRQGNLITGGGVPSGDDQSS